MTEKHSAHIELLRRRLAVGPEPTSATRRLTFLQGIAKATESASTDTKVETDEQSRRGWDADAIEDMWNAVLTYVREMGGLLNDLAGLKDIIDRAIDKAAVLPLPPYLVTRVLTYS